MNMAATAAKPANKIINMLDGAEPIQIGSETIMWKKDSESTGKLFANYTRLNSVQKIGHADTLVILAYRVMEGKINFIDHHSPINFPKEVIPVLREAAKLVAEALGKEIEVVPHFLREKQSEIPLRLAPSTAD